MQTSFIAKHTVNITVPCGVSIHQLHNLCVFTRSGGVLWCGVVRGFSVTQSVSPLGQRSDLKKLSNNAVALVQSTPPASPVERRRSTRFSSIIKLEKTEELAVC